MTGGVAQPGLSGVLVVNLEVDTGKSTAGVFPALLSWRPHTAGYCLVV